MTNQEYFTMREVCPACTGRDAQQLYACRFTDPPISTYLQDFYSVQGGIEFEYLQDVEYILDECKSCGLIFQRFIPNDFLMKKLYEEWIDPETALQARYKARGVEYYARLSKEIEMVIRSLSKKGSGLDVFDFGMGWGNWCLMAKAYGCVPFGTELSQSRIEHARELGITVVSWDDIPKHQFDFINTEQVFEHIATPLETLRHLSKALKLKE